MIAENVEKLTQQVRAAALSAGRSPDDILIVAASKTKPPEDIREAVRAGIRAAGENRVQEFTEKYAAGAYEGAQAHFIGHLQTNKVKFVVGKAALIQSVDTPHLAREIDRQARALGIVQPVLLEVNIGGEASKFGFDPGTLRSTVSEFVDFGNLRVLGLMTVAPKTESAEERRRYFAKMHQLFIDIGREKYDNIEMKYLSMGMSADFLEAISEGSNMIRIGTGIFGARASAISDDSQKG